MEEIANYVPQMYATFWALIPPVVAIVLALITKEVYSSLFLGIVIGGLFWSNFRFEATVNHVFKDGIVRVLTNSGISCNTRCYGLYDEQSRWFGSVRTMGKRPYQDADWRTVSVSCARCFDLY